MFYSFTEWLRRYYYLTKPGIVINNTLTAIAGVLFAGSQVELKWLPAVAVVVGTAMVIASACVYNNVIDRRIDRLMERTKKRSLVTGMVSVQGALTFATGLGIIGFTLLYLFTNTLTLIIGLLAYVSYLLLYGYTKRRSEHGTLVGTIPGALPPVAGYVALTNRLDIAAVIIFFMLVAWQMAHFYAIAIYRKKEYAKAKVPILSVTRGYKPVMEQMIIYIAAFIVVSVNLTIAGYAGATFAVTLVAVGAVWLMKALKAYPLKGKNLEAASRRLFGFSLLVNLVMCAGIAAGGYLP